MVEKKVVVQLKQGLHARPASEFVKIASTFSSDIKIGKNGKLINGKSIIGIMSMGVSHGEEVILTADGADEMDALESLAKHLVEGEE